MMEQYFIHVRAKDAKGVIRTEKMGPFHSFDVVLKQRRDYTEMGLPLEDTWVELEKSK